MFTVSELKHGAVDFVKFNPKDAGIYPDIPIPGGTAYHSVNSFGQLFYQHIDGRRFSIWKSRYAPKEDITLRVAVNAPWLGFRLMLRKHIRHSVAGQQISLMQGQVNFAYVPTATYEFRLKKGEVYEVFDMQVTPELLKDLKVNEPQLDNFLERIGTNKPEWLVAKPAWGNVMVLDMVDYLIKEPTKDALVQEVVKQVVRALTRQRSEERTITEQQLENLYAVREIIKEQFPEQMHLQEWATKAQMNITYFKEMFKQVFELTPYHYLLYERLKGAKEMMINNPDMSFAEVAQLCGFGSYNNLRRAFQARENKTLTEWRNLPDFLAITIAWEMLLEM